MNHEENHLVAKVKAVNTVNAVCNAILEKKDAMSAALLNKKLITQKEEIPAVAGKFLIDFSKEFEKDGIDSIRLLFSGRGGYRFSVTVRACIGYGYTRLGRVEQSAVYQEKQIDIFRLREGVATEVFATETVFPTNWTIEEVKKNRQEISRLEDEVAKAKMKMADFRR